MNIIDGIKIKSIERCQFKVSREYIQEVDPTTFTDESKIVHWKMAISRSEQQQNLKGTTRKKRKKRRAFSQLGPAFKYFADCLNLSLKILMIYIC